MSSEETSCNCAQLFGFSADEDGVRPEQEPLKERNTLQTQNFIRQTPENEQKLRSIHPSIFFPTAHPALRVVRVLQPIVAVSGRRRGQPWLFCFNTSLQTGSDNPKLIL